MIGKPERKIKFCCEFPPTERDWERVMKVQTTAASDTNMLMVTNHVRQKISAQETQNKMRVVAARSEKEQTSWFVTRSQDVHSEYGSLLASIPRQAKLHLCVSVLLPCTPTAKV